MQNQPSVFSMPVYVPQQQRNEDSPPVRVLVALSFLRDLAQKEMKRVAINDLQIQEIDGAVLTKDESNAKTAAHVMLGDYFRGTLEPDRLEAVQEQFARKELEQKEDSGKLLHCPSCVPGSPSVGCRLCNGGGWCILIPAKGEDK